MKYEKVPGMNLATGEFMGKRELFAWQGKGVN